MTGARSELRTSRDEEFAVGWVKNEKAALVATLRDVDPDAPTLDEGWDVRRLLAHLVQREQGPITSSIADAVAKKQPGEEAGLSRLCDAARTRQGYDDLVSRFAAGPPTWSPMSWAGERFNLLEYLIHHEDIRRAGVEPSDPRPLPIAEQRAVWQQLGFFAKLSLRTAPGGVQLATTDGATRVVKKGDGVTLTGDPLELALYVSGRRPQARVGITGSPAAVAEFTLWATR